MVNVPVTMLIGVGISLALFGTVLLYFAAEKVLGEGGEALLWTNLIQKSGELEPTVLSLAFVFLVVGYGTKVGLVPLHNWLPDAALVRCKALVDGSTHTHHWLALEQAIPGNIAPDFPLCNKSFNQSYSGHDL